MRGKTRIIKNVDTQSADKGSACTTLETDILGANSNTANIRKYNPIGKILCLEKIFKYKDG